MRLAQSPLLWAAKDFPRISKSRASPKEPIPLTARKLERGSLKNALPHGGPRVRIHLPPAESLCKPDFLDYGSSQTSSGRKRYTDSAKIYPGGTYYAGVVKQRP